MSQQTNEHRFPFFSPDSSHDETPQTGSQAHSLARVCRTLEFFQMMQVRADVEWQLSVARQARDNAAINLALRDLPLRDLLSAEEKKPEEDDESTPMNQPD